MSALQALIRILLPSLLTVAFALALLAVTLTVRSEADTACTPRSAFIADVVARTPDAILVPVNAAAYMNALNRLPPASQYPTPEELLLFKSARRSSVMLAGVVQGCVMMKLIVPVAVDAQVQKTLGLGI